ncbi:MAG: DUF4124 domain-containing protein [Rhodanobacteraceae bacterium]
MQLRTLFAASAIGLSIACIAGFASAQQIYRWKDSSGVIHFSQTPPTNGAHYTKMHLSSTPEVSSQPPAPAAVTSNTDNDNAGAPQHPDRQKTEADTPSNRAALCKQLSSNITLLQGKQPVVTGGGNGKQQVMSDNAREQQLATAHAQQAQYCSGGGGA